MENKYLACCGEGIPIQYNTHERNNETVFVLTNDFQIVQNMAFRCPIYPDSVCWSAWKSECQKKKLL